MNIIRICWKSYDIVEVGAPMIKEQIQHELRLILEQILKTNSLNIHLKLKVRINKPIWFQHYQIKIIGTDLPEVRARGNVYNCKDM